MTIKRTYKAGSKSSLINNQGIFAEKATTYKVIDLPACPTDKSLDLFVNIDFRTLGSDCEVKIDSNLCKNGTTLEQQFPLVFGCQSVKFSTNLTAPCQSTMPNSRQLISSSCVADPSLLSHFFNRATHTIEQGLSSQYSEDIITSFQNWRTNLIIDGCDNSYNFTSCSMTSDKIIQSNPLAFWLTLGCLFCFMLCGIPMLALLRPVIGIVADRFINPQKVKKLRGYEIFDANTESDEFEHTQQSEICSSAVTEKAEGSEAEGSSDEIDGEFFVIHSTLQPV